MEKFSSEIVKHSNLQKKLFFSYYNTNLYLDFCGYVFKRNGEDIIVWQDCFCLNEFPCIFLPKNKKNWVNCIVTFATNKDIELIKKENIEILINKSVGSEFFYKTKDFLNPRGKFKNRINQFVSNYKYSIKNKYNKKKILEFYDFWRKQRDHKNNVLFEEEPEYFKFCLNNLNKYNVKQVYIEVDNKLVGIAWGINFPRTNNWIGLHLKVNYSYKGLSRFLFQQRAKLFSNFEEFSLGNDVNDEGISKYKKELNPYRKEGYSYIVTCGRL